MKSLLNQRSVDYKDKVGDHKILTIVLEVFKIKTSDITLTNKNILIKEKNSFKNNDKAFFKI